MAHSCPGILTLELSAIEELSSGLPVIRVHPSRVMDAFDFAVGTCLRW